MHKRRQLPILSSKTCLINKHTNFRGKSSKLAKNSLNAKYSCANKYAASIIDVEDAVRKAVLNDIIIIVGQTAPVATAVVASHSSTSLSTSSYADARINETKNPGLIVNATSQRRTRSNPKTKTRATKEN